MASTKIVVNVKMGRSWLELADIHDMLADLEPNEADTRTRRNVSAAIRAFTERWGMAEDGGDL